MNTPDQVIAAVCREFCIRRETLFDHHHHRRYALMPARQMLAVALDELTDLTWVEMAAIQGLKSHATAVYRAKAGRSRAFCQERLEAIRKLCA